MQDVIIGVDPHKLSATIEVVDRNEQLLGSGRFSTDRAGSTAMRTSVKAWPDRVWAIEGANGAGRSLAQRLVEAASMSSTCLQPPSSRRAASGSAQGRCSRGTCSYQVWQQPQTDVPMAGLAEALSAARNVTPGST